MAGVAEVFAKTLIGIAVVDIRSAVGIIRFLRMVYTQGGRRKG